MNPGLRFVRFNAVGAAGIGVQLAALWLLTGVMHVHYLTATSLAVGTAIVHNFLWHRRWTWAERAGIPGGDGPVHAVCRCQRGGVARRKSGGDVRCSFPART